MEVFKRRACAHCISLKARCDHARPCSRCARKGLACVDVLRKPRLRKEANIALHMQEIEQIEKLVNFLQQPNSQQILPQTTPFQQQKESTPPIYMNDNAVGLPSSFDAEFDSLISPSIEFDPISIVTSSLSPSMNIPSTPSPDPFASSSSPSTSISTSTSASPSIPNSPDSPAYLTSCNNSSTSNNTNIESTELTTYKPIVPSDQSTNFENNGIAINVISQLQALKKTLETVVSYMEFSMPKELPTPDEKAIAIINPQKFEMIDCSNSFCEVLGRTYQSLKGAHASNFCLPFFFRMLKKDMAYCAMQGVSSAVKFKYAAFQHGTGGVVYCLESINMSPSHAIITISKLYQDIPPCMKLAFDHYLGITSVHRSPPIPCDIEYCHCKLLHLPLPP